MRPNDDLCLVLIHNNNNHVPSASAALGWMLKLDRNIIPAKQFNSQWSSEYASVSM